MLVLAMAIGGPLIAAPARGIRSLITEPIAAQGGVLMLPLAAQRPGNAWPETITLNLANAETVDATVVWIEPRRVDPVRRREWSDDPTDVIVRPIARSDDSSRPTGGAPYLLARLPVDGQGVIRLGNQVLAPEWRHPRESYADAPLPAGDRPEMFLTWLPDRPDPFSPFEYWRWALLADRIDLQPPPLERFGDVGALVAEHYAGLWRIGLAHLGRHDAAAAVDARAVLTRLVNDGHQPFAAWVSGTSDPAQLLALLLDFSASGSTLVRDVRAWIDARPSVLAWLEAEHGEYVRLAVVNRGFESFIGRLAWEDAPDDHPVAVELPAGTLTRVTVDRPAVAAPPQRRIVTSAAAPLPRVLALTTPNQRLRINVGPPSVVAIPPGVAFARFHPALTLADVQSGRQIPQDPASATTAQVRRRGERWEVFFDCRRPSSETTESPVGGADTAPTSLVDIPGNEGVTVIIGDEAAPDLAVFIPESGAIRVMAGNDDGTLGVHRQSFSDRWYCRVELPVSAVQPIASQLDENDDPRDGLRLSAIRSHGAGASVETMPAATVPWRRSVPPAILLVDDWDRPRVDTVN